MIIREAVVASARCWPPAAGDTNLVDVAHHATRIVAVSDRRLPTELPNGENGLKIVEAVDRVFIRGDLIRTLAAEQLGTRAEQLVQILFDERLFGHEPLVTYAAALYAWHGCISMAKCVRPAYVAPDGLVPYTRADRETAYAHIQQHLRYAEFQSGVWVRYGVSLARALEIRRGNQVIDDWIPGDSPYWSGPEMAGSAD